MIIYPPFIGETIPAFTTQEIIIPFFQNPAVSWEEVQGFSLIIKNYNSSVEQARLTISKEQAMYDNDTRSGHLRFTIAAAGWKPTIKQYYKFQLGYLDDSEEAVYSSVSIGRCVGDGNNSPLRLDVLSGTTTLRQGSLNINTVKYTGRTRTSIMSEPIYSYRFYVNNSDTGEIIQDTGYLLNNIDTDDIEAIEPTYGELMRNSIHEFTLEYELDTGEYYTLTYEVVTVNNYKQSISYTIVNGNGLPSDFDGALLVYQDAKAKDNGYVHIGLQINMPYKGTFIIERTSDKKHWEELTEFSITCLSDAKYFAWTDWTVAQGEHYTYAMRQKYGTYLSERMCETTIRVEFEDMFLSDGQKQLRIRFDPKVSSFKDTIQDQKTNTLGNKYPLFFRNGAVQYKEIPIAGLISYWMDTDRFFCSLSDIGLEDDLVSEWTDTYHPTTNLENYNIAAERKFKLLVLDWLNSPTPKLFRSPSEGNYVVRLMNNSLTPNDTLGRMLHSFTSTASEVADNNIKSLKQLSLIHMPFKEDPPPQKVLYTLTPEWFDENNSEAETKEFLGQNIEQVSWYGIPSFHDKLQIDDKYYINTTGSFITPPGIEFNKIVVNRDMLVNGSISFYYTPEVSQYQGTDTFAEMIQASEDILFSAPVNTTLRKDANTGILLNVDPTNPSVVVSETALYKTYIMVARRDINYVSDNPEDFKLTFIDEHNNNEKTYIDCSDGQVRYYYNLNSHIKYEKGLGLHLDIYARTQTVGASARLGNFILDVSRLA